MTQVGAVVVGRRAELERVGRFLGDVHPEIAAQAFSSRRTVEANLALTRLGRALDASVSA